MRITINGLFLYSKKQVKKKIKKIEKKFEKKILKVVVVKILKLW
jgi:hypothetical protein